MIGIEVGRRDHHAPHDPVELDERGGAFALRPRRDEHRAAGEAGCGALEACAGGERGEIECRVAVDQPGDGARGETRRRAPVG